MGKTIIIAAVLATAGSAGAAHAQYRATAVEADVADEYDAYDDFSGVAGPLVFSLGAAVNVPVSDSGSRFDPGWGFTAGLNFIPRGSLVGIRGEYLFSHHDVEGDVLDASELDGDQSFHYGTVNVMVRPPNMQRFGFYVIGGGGVYYRRVEVTEFAGVGATTYCDPYLFFCYPTAVPLENVLGSEDSFDFGVNGGLGVYALLTPPMRLFLEARYHYMWGPEFDSPTGGDPVDSDGQYLPVVLGLTF